MYLINSNYTLCMSMKLNYCTGMYTCELFIYYLHREKIYILLLRNITLIQSLSRKTCVNNKQLITLLQHVRDRRVE